MQRLHIHHPSVQELARLFMQKHIIVHKPRSHLTRVMSDESARPVLCMIESALCTQVAAAAQPKDLGKRQRKKVSYNEAAQARNRTTSTSDSEFRASDVIEEDDDEDDEDGASGSGVEAEGADGKKVKRLRLYTVRHTSKMEKCLTLSRLLLASHLCQKVCVGTVTWSAITPS